MSDSDNKTIVGEGSQDGSILAGGKIELSNPTVSIDQNLMELLVRYVLNHMEDYSDEGAKHYLSLFNVLCDLDLTNVLDSIAEAYRKEVQKVLAAAFDSDKSSDSSSNSPSDRFKTGDFKNDKLDHKLRMDLLPLDVLEAVTLIYNYGAIKYKPNSWRTLSDGANRYRAALLRHLSATSYEECDQESHLPHVLHLAWNALALVGLYLDENPEFKATEIAKKLEI